MIRRCKSHNQLLITNKDDDSMEKNKKISNYSEKTNNLTYFESKSFNLEKYHIEVIFTDLDELINLSKKNYHTYYQIKEYELELQQKIKKISQNNINLKHDEDELEEQLGELRNKIGQQQEMLEKLTSKQFFEFEQINDRIERLYKELKHTPIESR